MQLIDGKIRALARFSGDYWLLRVAAPTVAAAARPGQFVHLRVPDLGDTALRRPFSIYRADDGELAILFKPVGSGTERMTSLREGQSVSLLGPLGNGFPALRDAGRPLLIAGGYGVAPLAFLARRLPVRGVLLVGGRTADDILCVEEFESLGWEVRVATEDGSRGTRGRVTLLLDAALAAAAPGSVELFACGPDGLLRAVGECAARAGCRAWLSLDKHMVCGVGACLACVQKLRQPDGSVRMARVCHDGPVFEAGEIVWENPS